MAHLAAGLAFPLGGDALFVLDLPPVVSNFVPANARPVGTFGVVQFDVTDESGASVLTRILVDAEFEALSELVYNGSFTRLYASSIKQPIQDGYRFTVRRSGPWKTAPRINGLALEQSGLISDEPADLSGNPPGAPPVVSSFLPTPGTILRPADAVQFDVTDDSGLLRRVYIAASYPARGVVEVLYDGKRFRKPYVGQASAIGGGFHFQLQRVGGWPASFTLMVYAIDREGLESA